MLARRPNPRLRLLRLPLGLRGDTLLLLPLAPLLLLLALALLRGLRSGNGRRFLAGEPQGGVHLTLGRRPPRLSEDVGDFGQPRAVLAGPRGASAGCSGVGDMAAAEHGDVGRAAPVGARRRFC